MKKLLLLFLIAITAMSIKAQQDPMFTHYMHNTLSVNPGYAGSRDALTVMGLYRHQWVAFPGAPITQTLTIHTPIGREFVGLGISIINDKIGPTSMTSLYGDFAYRLKINENGHKLSLGLKAGINILNNNLASLKLQNVDDHLFMDIQNETLPNFGLGVYYSAPRYYIGLSTPKLLQNFVPGKDNANILNEKRHYFFISGAMIKIDNYWDLKPTILIKAVKNSPIEADVTASIYYQQKLWCGLGYRSRADLMFLIGFQFTETFAMGYSFDWSFPNLTARYNQGSHEIMFIYDFIFNNHKRIISPRYF